MQTRLYIGGQFVDGLAGGTIEVINPADGTVLATVASAAGCGPATCPGRTGSRRPSGPGMVWVNSYKRREDHLRAGQS